MPEGTWDTKYGVAHCGYCGSAVSLPRNFRPRLRMPMPPGIGVSHEDGGLLITHRWLSKNGLIGFLATAVALILLYAPDASGRSLSESGDVMLAHVVRLVALGSAYYSFAYLVNRSWVRIRNGVVAVCHGPLPWWGTRCMPCCEVDQCFSRSRVVETKNGSIEYFELWVASTNGTASKLLATGSLTLDQVLYMEQQIEQALGIEDRPMPGEISRGIV
jgi:hypothetical protein